MRGLSSLCFACLVRSSAAATQKPAGFSKGGIVVIDGFLDEHTTGKLFSELPESITDGTRSQTQKIEVNITANLRSTLLQALRMHEQGGEHMQVAFGSNDKQPLIVDSQTCAEHLAGRVPVTGITESVRLHRDLDTTTKVPVRGSVAVLYLRGGGKLTFKSDSETQHVDIKPGRLIMWPNHEYLHELQHDANSPRLLLGPMTATPDGGFVRVGGGGYDCGYRECPPGLEAKADAGQYDISSKYGAFCLPKIFPTGKFDFSKYDDCMNNNVEGPFCHPKLNDFSKDRDEAVKVCCCQTPCAVAPPPPPASPCATNVLYASEDKSVGAPRTGDTSMARFLPLAGVLALLSGVVMIGVRIWNKRRTPGEFTRVPGEQLINSAPVTTAREIVSDSEALINHIQSI